MRLPRQLSLRAWLLLSYLAVFSLPWVALIGSGALARDLRAQTRETLVAQGHVWALQIERELSPALGLASVSEHLHDVLAEARARTLCSVQVVDQVGRVLASSGGSVGHSLAADLEVQRALAGQVAGVERPRPDGRSHDLTNLGGPSHFAAVRSFVAVPIGQAGAVVGAVVLSRTPREEFQTLWQMAPQLLGALLAVAGFTVALALGSGYLGSRSLGALATAAGAMGRGEPRPASLERLQSSRVREVADLSAALATMHRRLQHRMDDIDSFATTVAHEFRTTTATLRGTHELLQDEPDMAPEQRAKFFANATRELRRLETVLEGLLALARAERPSAGVAIDLDTVVRALASTHGVEVRGQGRPVAMAADRLELVLDNLIGNARQHGGDDVTVRVELVREASMVGFDVIDDGPGIAAADLPRVFDRFFTTDRRQGVGLGLALVRMAVTAQGGTVTVHSQPGGTVFAVRLPG